MEDVVMVVVVAVFLPFPIVLKKFGVNKKKHVEIMCHMDRCKGLGQHKHVTY
jgi:hypothetical protein